MSADALIERLQGVRRNGPGRWMARCPAHEDGRPSLSVRELPDGRVLIYCFAGCGATDVIGAVGLEFSALFPENGPEYAPALRRSPVNVREVATALGFELEVACILLGDAAAGRPVDRARADDAMRRIRRFTRELELAS